jgi:hypothetical protein
MGLGRVLDRAIEQLSPSSKYPQILAESAGIVPSSGRAICERP